jgi:hypothetical protein
MRTGGKTTFEPVISGRASRRGRGSRMTRWVLPVIGVMLISAPVEASELVGPGRFCGYAAIIDLLPGEKIAPLEGGMHGGSFLWTGRFGSLKVVAIGWASRPKGRTIEAATSTRPARFTPRRESGRYEVAIWNGSHGAAYFISSRPITAMQSEAIGRVALFEEGQEPPGCELRTLFLGTDGMRAP